MFFQSQRYQRKADTRERLSDAMRSAERKNLRGRISDEIYTCCAFWIAVSALPALTLSYFVVRASKHLWLKLLSSRYPNLQFIRTDTIRSLLDTARNQGIINVLLCVKGTLDTDKVRQQLMQHVVERRDKNGDYMFPRLRQQLVSCWGNYAWDANAPFRPDNHFIVGNGVYRGRPVTDNNLQDYVSEIVSKYFPSDQPPWQFITIPFISTEPTYYILVRVHHLLLTGKKSINIGDLLLVEQLKTSEIITAESQNQQSPLLKLFPVPSAIPELWEKINEMVSNSWNEFVSEYDPVESPQALKSLPGAFHTAGLVLVSAVSALRELTKKQCYDRDSTSGPLTAMTFIAAVQRECKRRNLTLPKILISPFVTADPRKWPKRAINTAVSSTRALIKFPIRFRNEMTALKELKISGHVRNPDTIMWKYGGLAQLAVKASSEAWRGLLEAYRAPAKLWKDTVRTDNGERHPLQTVSLCGRKVAAWSRPVSRTAMERAARALGVSSSDIALFAATEALRSYFEQTHSQIPEVVLTTARAATEDFLFTFAEGDGKKYKKSQTGGMVCLSLPVGATPRRIASVVERACDRQRALAAAWSAQARYGALTRSVPSPFARLTLNLLSRRYAVSYAEINAPNAAGHRMMLWGQRLESVVYWRPPQANISMSLTVIQYADSVRLAIMTDSRLVPGHTIPANRWPTAVEQLISRVDQQIARISSQYDMAPSLEPAPVIVETTTLEYERADESEETKPSTSSLRLPETQPASPPPLRRTVSHH